MRVDVNAKNVAGNGLRGSNAQKDTHTHTHIVMFMLIYPSMIRFKTKVIAFK